MSRIPLVQVDDMSPEQRKQYDRFPSNLTRTLLRLDTRLARALPESANALRASDLEPALREAVILRVAALSDSPYERMQHLEQVKKTGWSDADISAIETRDDAARSGQLSAILAFVDELVTSTHVSNAAFAAAHEVLADRDLATIIILVGHYMMVARLIGTLEIELDPEPDSWVAEH